MKSATKSLPLIAPLERHPYSDTEVAIGTAGVSCCAASMSISNSKEMADRIADERKQKRIREAEKNRAEFAAAVWKQHDSLMARVDQLVAEKITKSYDTAVRILKAVCHACQNDDELRHLYEKTRALRVAHPRLVGLRSRLEEAGLCEGIEGRSDAGFMRFPDENSEQPDWTIFDL